MDNHTPQGLGCVVVLGMHRAGTSLAAAILRCLGVQMGTRFRKPDVHNPSGYFEDLDWRDLNHDLLAASGGTWYKPPSAAAIRKLASNRALATRTQALVSEKTDLAKRHLWGFKDPRTCLTIPFLYRHLPPVRFVAVIRPAEDIVRSLMLRAKRRGYYEAPEHWNSLVNLYQLRRVTFMLGNRAPTYVVSYDHLVHDARGNIVGLAQFLGITDRDRIDRAIDIVRHPEPTP